MSVKVAKHPQTGNVITPSSRNPEYGTIRLDSEHTSMEGGFVSTSRRSAFLRGKIEDLNGLGLSDGKTLPGQIIKKESFEPFYDGQNPKINPTSGEVVLTDGKETYLQYEYTQDMGACDKWISNEPSAEAVVASENAQEALADQAV